MKPIRLTPGQKRCLKVNHPLLDGCSKPNEGEFISILDRWDKGDESARDELIMSHRFLVKNVVGRFLANWPESHRFEDDMVSEGFTAIVELIDSQDFSDFSYNAFHKRMWSSVISKIETMLNNQRATFSSGLTTNRSREEAGEETEYCYAQQIREDLDLGYEDNNPSWVDALDELQNFKEEDREHWRTVIIRYMETEHGIDETELTEKELQAIEHISKIAGDL